MKILNLIKSRLCTLNSKVEEFIPTLTAQGPKAANLFYEFGTRSISALFISVFDTPLDDPTANFDFQPVILQLAKHSILKIKLILIHVLAIKEYKPFHVVLFVIFGRYFGTKICYDNKYNYKLLIGPNVYKLKK